MAGEAPKAARGPEARRRGTPHKAAGDGAAWSRVRVRDHGESKERCADARARTLVSTRVRVGDGKVVDGKVGDGRAGDGRVDCGKMR